MADPISFLFGGVGVTVLSLIFSFSLTFWLDWRREKQALTHQLSALLAETDMNIRDARFVEGNPAWAQPVLFTPFSDSASRAVVSSPGLYTDKNGRKQTWDATYRALQVIQDVNAFIQQRNVLSWQQPSENRQGFNRATASFIEQNLSPTLKELRAHLEVI
jgi:hypothetical protein